MCSLSNDCFHDLCSVCYELSVSAAVFHGFMVSAVTMVTAVNNNEGSVYNCMGAFYMLVYMSVHFRHRPL